MSAGAGDRADPARAARSSARARRSWRSRCCAPGRLSLGPMGERFEREFADWLGVEDAVAVSSGTAALHLGVRALGWGAGDEVLTSPFSFVASANCLLYEGARPVFCDVDPETLNLDPAAAAAAVGERTAGILPVHIFGYPAAMPELEALAAEHGPRHPRGRLRGARRGRLRGPRGRRPRQPRHLRLLRQQADDDGGGGDDRPHRRRGRRPAALRAQPGPRRRHGLARPRRARLQLPPLRPRRRARRRPGREARRDARRGAPRSPRSTPSGLAGIEGVEAPDRRPRRASGAAGSSTRSGSPEGVDRDATIGRLAERGIASKAYLPCIHLFPHLRELGYREGQFPVAEAASARSLALPFFPSMSEDQVERVCARLSRDARSAVDGIIAAMSRFRKDPDPRFWRINRSLEFDWRLAPYDIDQSQAHAAGSAADRRPRRRRSWSEIDAGLERVGSGSAEHGFEFEDADEDIHMAIERLLGEEIGPLAGKLHTGRSRNDQVATDVAMVVQAHSLRAIELCRGGDGAAARARRGATATGRCPATPTCSAPSRSTSATTCSPTSGCSPATSCASSSPSTAPA